MEGRVAFSGESKIDLDIEPILELLSYPAYQPVASGRLQSVAVVVGAPASVCTVHDDASASHVLAVSIDPLSTVDDDHHDSEIFHGVHHLCLQLQSCPN